MKRRLIAVFAVAAVLLTLVGATGCTRVRLQDVEGPSGMESDRRSIELGDAATLEARINMAMGELSVGAGDTAALDAEFLYSPRTWKPEVDYSVESSAGILRLDQPMEDPGVDVFGNNRNEWDLRLARNIPLDLRVRLGAGQSMLDLSELDVRTLDALTGAGETTIDLSGVRSNDVTARIESGLGVLTVRVPAGTGVRVTTISEGVGEFSAEGLHAQGDDYVNDAYATSSVKMEISLHRGLGEVVFESVP